MRSRLFFSAGALFLVVLAANATILFATLSGSYAEAVVQQYGTIAKSLRLLKENDVFRNNKVLRNAFLNRVSKRVDFISSRRQSVLALSNNRLSGSQAVVGLVNEYGMSTPNYGYFGGIDRLLPPDVLNSINQKRIDDAALVGTYTLRVNGFQYVAAPIADQHGGGYAVIRLTEESVVPSLFKFVLDTKSELVTTLLLGMIFIALIVMSTRVTRAEEASGRRQFVTAVSLVAIVGQIVVVVAIAKGFSTQYLDISRANAEWVTTLIAKRVNNSSVSEDAEKAAVGRIISTVPDVISVTVNRDGVNRYTVENVNVVKKNRAAVLDSPFLAPFIVDESERDYVKTKSIGRGDDYQGRVYAAINRNLVSERRYESVFDGVMSVVIGLLIFVELIILLNKYVERLYKTNLAALKRQAMEKAKSQSGGEFHHSLMRPAMFLFLFGIDISISFLPLHMERLYEPLFGLSKNVVMGLPISVEFLCVGIAILGSGYWLDRSGWHKPFIGGLVFASLGSLYSCLATDALHFIISRGFVGIGYGFAIMAAQGFVVRYSEEKNQAQGLATVFAGLYAGSIGGGAAGGMLAERFGYNTIFIVGALVLGMAVIYTIVFLRGAFAPPPERRNRPRMEHHDESQPGLMQFLTNRSVIALAVFSSVPASIAVIGFLNYFSPIYMNRIGLDESVIGQVLIIYGVCLIFLGPWAGKVIDAAGDKRPLMFLGCVLGAASLLVFQFMSGLPAIIVAILLLGLSSSIVISATPACVLQLPISKQIGDGKALGIFSTAGRIGQTIGPMAFAAAIGLSANVEAGVTWLGYAYLVTAVLFFLMLESRRAPARVGVPA